MTKVNKKKLKIEFLVVLFNKLVGSTSEVWYSTIPLILELCATVAIKNILLVLFKDMHGEGNYAPLMDDQQDVEVLGGKEENGWTVVRFRRKLQTCDKQDMSISVS